MEAMIMTMISRKRCIQTMDSRKMPWTGCTAGRSVDGWTIPPCRGSDGVGFHATMISKYSIRPTRSPACHDAEDLVAVEKIPSMPP